MKTPLYVQRFLGCVRWAFVIGIMSLTSMGRAEISKEYQIKAAFVFNFCQFIEWPSSAFADGEAPFRIGVMGDDPFGSALEETIRGEKVDNRKLAVERSTDLEALKKCQLIFVSKSEKGQMREVLSGLKDSPVVTVSEMDGFARRGGIINFFIENGKVRFEINLGTAKRKGLKMSSQLLKLGKIVESGREEK